LIGDDPAIHDASQFPSGNSQCREPFILREDNIANVKHSLCERSTDDVVALEAVVRERADLGDSVRDGIDDHEFGPVVSNAVFEAHGITLGSVGLIVPATEYDGKVGAVFEYMADSPVHEIRAARLAVVIDKAPDRPAYAAAT